MNKQIVILHVLQERIYQRMLEVVLHVNEEIIVNEELIIIRLQLKGNLLVQIDMETLQVNHQGFLLVIEISLQDIICELHILRVIQNVLHEHTNRHIQFIMEIQVVVTLVLVEPIAHLHELVVVLPVEHENIVLNEQVLVVLQVNDIMLIIHVVRLLVQV